MNKKFELEIGKTYYPPKQKIFMSDNSVKGSWWSVWKEDEEYKFEFLASRHGGGVDIHSITREEFEAIRAGHMTVDDLMKKYDT